nr:hypothetical protein [Tanacetum cinerariifolium]
MGYTEEIVHDFEQRHETIFGRKVNRVHILDFKGLTPDMRQDLAKRMRMEMVEDGFSAYWLRSERVISNKGGLSDYWVEISFRRDFWRGDPSYTYIRDLVRRLCHSMDRGAANVPYQLAHYLFKYVEGRKSSARLSGEHFIGRLAHHFGLVSDDGLRGLSVMTREIPVINMGELVKLNICKEIGDDWAWIAPRPKRQIKHGSKFSALVREYVTEQSTLSKSRAELSRRAWKLKKKSYLKTFLTSLKEIKSTMLVENLRFGNSEVLDVLKLQD